MHVYAHMYLNRNIHNIIFGQMEEGKISMYVTSAMEVFPFKT